MHVFFKEFLFFYSFCSTLFVFQFSVRTDRGRGLLSKKRTGVDRGERWVENWQKCADILYIWLLRKKLANERWIEVNNKKYRKKFRRTRIPNG